MRAILFAVIALAVAVILLCVGVIFRKDHSFRSQHIRENKRMREDGIKCATSQDREAQKANKKIQVGDL